jgi:hypothetical protein
MYGDAADPCIAEFEDMVRPEFIKEDNTNGFEGVHPLHITTFCEPVCMWLQTNEISHHIHLCFLVDNVVTLVNIEFDGLVMQDEDSEIREDHNILFEILQKGGVLPKEYYHY